MELCDGGGHVGEYTSLNVGATHGIVDQGGAQVTRASYAVQAVIAMAGP